MKLTAAVALAVAATATASPFWDDKGGNRWGNGWKGGHGKGQGGNDMCQNGPFKFTSTYDIVATPDQVVNSDNEFTGGLAVKSCTFFFARDMD